MKATSLFGGVQVFNILIGVIRTKIIAMLLGPVGMGIAGVLTSTTNLIGGLTNFGLSTSAVKNVSAAHASGDTQRISTVVTVLRRLVWITGLLGTLVTIIAAPYLSKISFNSNQYTNDIRLVASVLLLTQLNAGQLVLLQGMRQLKYLATANVLGMLGGLLVSVPVYYFMGERGIVPAILLSALVLLSISFYFSRRLKLQSTAVSARQTMQEGWQMLRMGFMISLSGLLSYVVTYSMNAYIGRTGSLAEVGLYNAGFSMINMYVGMVFSAMATDYYPRLSSIASDYPQATKLINQQAEVAVLIITPVLLLLMLFMDPVIMVLYTRKFLQMDRMLLFISVGLILKAATWALGFMILANSNSKVFIISELVANAYTLGFSMLGYSLSGLTGVGIAFVGCYMLSLIQTYFILRYYYRFSFTREFLQIMGLSFVLSLGSLTGLIYLKQPGSYILASVITLAAMFFSVRKLNSLIGLTDLIRNKLANRNR